MFVLSIVAFHTNLLLSDSLLFNRSTTETPGKRNWILLLNKISPFCYQIIQPIPVRLASAPRTSELINSSREQQMTKKIITNTRGKNEVKKKAWPVTLDGT